MSDYLPPPPSSGQLEPGRAVRHLRHADVRPCAPLRGLATALTVLFALIAIVEIARGRRLASTGPAIFDDTANGGFVSASTKRSSTPTTRSTALVGLHLLGDRGDRDRVHHLAVPPRQERRGAGRPRGLGPGWAIGGWFMPVANFVLPAVQLHQSSRKASDVAARRQGRRGQGIGPS